MHVILFDTETTSLEPATGQVIELAAQVYDTKSACVLASYAELIRAESNPCENVNHIRSDVLQSLPECHFAWDRVQEFWNRYGCEYFVAHNSDFDRQWCPSWMKQSQWCDTCYGVTWPRQSKEGASLISLMLDHGLAVVDPHRALNDTMMLARLLTRAAELGSDLDAIIKRGARPTAEYFARVSYERNQLAKAAGFHWRPEQKLWVRKIVIEEAMFAKEKWGFDVSLLQKGQS